MDSRYSVSGVKMAVYSYCIAWRDGFLNHVNNFGGADNATKGEHACTFQKV